MEQCRENEMLIMTPLFQADAPGNYVECQCINCARMGICHGHTGRCMSLQLCVAAENVGTGRNGAAYALLAAIRAALSMRACCRTVRETPISVGIVAPVHSPPLVI